MPNLSRFRRLARRGSSQTFGLGLLIWGFSVSPAASRELVHLRTGFSFEAESHQVDGDLITLIGQTGSLQFSKSDVLAIESLPDPKPAETKNSSPLPVKTPGAYLAEAAKRQGLPTKFLTSVAVAESGLNPAAVSQKGAVGLMQLMPSTAKLLGVSAENIEGNTEGGARYLRQLLLQYHGDSVLALAAYNAGPGAVARYGGVPPYPETQAYIGRVLKIYSQQPRIKDPGEHRGRSVQGGERK